MKRETRNSLLREFIERDFDENEILDVLENIVLFLHYYKEWLKNPKESETMKIHWRTSLENTLAAKGLDYTIGEIIDED